MTIARLLQRSIGAHSARSRVVRHHRSPQASATVLLVATFLILAPFPAPASENLVNYWKSEWPHTDFSRRAIALEEIMSGGPPKDGIPPIDKPRFDSTAIAATTLDPLEPVIVLVLGGRAKAYPLSILIWHEIVNDSLDGIPVSVTFCPLCNASIVFDRRVDGAVLDFGTTGKLRLSDLVMYDRQTQSWWQQFTGSGIVGRHTGTVLRKVESQIVSFADFRAAFPGGQVLSRATGFSRPYGRNPYSGYDDIHQSPFLLSAAPDARLPPMERVVSVTAGGISRIYPFKVLERTPVINDMVGGEPVVILSRLGTLSVLDDAEIRASRKIHSANAFSRRVGRRTLEFEVRKGRIIDRRTRSEWNLLGQATAGTLKGQRLAPATGGVHFAFAWLAFNPGTEIYE